MKNNINEISSSEFRNKIKSLGFTEKGSELTSGGEINSAFLDIMNNLVTDWKKMGGSNCPLKFTSGNDKFHKNITDYVSRHTKGEAMDVTLPNGCHSSFITLLKTYKTKYNGFDYIDEYRNPTKKELTYEKHTHGAAFAYIRWHARKVVMKDKELKCEICSYSNHVEVAHIKSIASFSEDSKLLEINNSKFEDL